MKKLIILFLFAPLFNGIYYGQIDSARFLKTVENCKVYIVYFEDYFIYNWQGDCQNGYANGRGILSISIGDNKIAEYNGFFDKGIPQGTFSLKYNINESQFECNFKDGRQVGKGSYKVGSGSEYFGEMRDLNIHGAGIMKYSKGTVFNGKFKMAEQWTGYYVDLKNDTTFLYKGDKIDRISFEKFSKIKSSYKPELNKELTEYFDSSFVRCDKIKAVYYRKITYKEDHIPNGFVKDYRVSSGSLWRKVKFSYIDYEDEALSYFDACDYDSYYSNGELESTFKIGYEGNVIGKAKFYHENGALKEIRNYNRFGKLDGHSVILDKNGELERYGSYASGNLEGDCYFDISKDGNWSKVYLEDFNKNFDEWKKSEFVDLYYDFLFINNKPTKSYFNTKPFPIDAANQFNLSSTFRTKKKTFRKNDFIGLIFDYNDNSSYSVLLVDGSNTAYIYSYIYNEPKLIAKEKLKLNKSEFVEYDLTINFFTDGIRFNVNNQLIHLMPNWNWVGGKEFGITISGGENFIVKQLSAVEFFDSETSKRWSKWAENKVLNDNPTDYDASGSGFFISQEGHFVTNYHVIENASSIEIELKMAGETVSFPARVVVKDKTNDLAILKIDNKDFKFDELLPYVISFQTMDVGTEVFTLGYPMIEVMGSEIKFTDGKISSKSGLDGDITTYQITTPIQPGNSGGPIFNENGEIVGIVVSTLNRENFTTVLAGISIS